MQIPKSVIDVVSETLGWHYTHRGLDLLFSECGAPGEAPVGKNKVDKCSVWLKLTNTEASIDPLQVLGKLLEYYMDYEIPKSNFNIMQWEDNRERIHRALARHGLVYEFGGMVRATHGSNPQRALDQILRTRDLPGVEEEFRRLEDALDPDPRGALTAACALLEALFKIYIEDEALEMPRDQTIKPLWSVVSKELGLDPASLPDDDLKRILSGLTSVVDGLGALRTHAGSAHGRGRVKYRPEPRHARVVANSACTLATFVLETWEKRKRQQLSKEL
jgi:hypothetical protein